MSGPGAVLEFRGVGKSFPSPGGPVHVLGGVSFALAPGEFLGITGPSGSGKTTLLHLAALLEPPTRGTIFLEGAEVSSCNEEELSGLRSQRIGMVFQQCHLLPHRSVLDNVLFRFRYLDVAPARAEGLARSILDRLGLAGIEDRPARVLSGGEMQRVAIARALVAEPALLVADEPTGNLDAAAAETVMESFARLNAEGHTILLVTHNPALLPYCSRAVSCRAGALHEEAA